jgi:hypothetical protein
LGFNITLSEYFAHVKKVEPNKFAFAFHISAQRRKVSDFPRPTQKINAGIATDPDDPCI